MLSGPEEAQLARAAANGDGHAFAALYDAYEHRIHNYCQRLLGSEHDADDATQEAFLNVLRRLPELEDRELDFGAYLFTAARNSSYEMIRKQKRAEPVEEVPERGERPATGGPPPEDDPALAAMLGAHRHSVQAANARLPERQREVLVLREVEEMSYEQIASLMDMNVNSVAQLISRARIRLRGELRGEEAAAITPASRECERALPLLSLRLDGNLDDEADREWLEGHLASCETCALAAEAMEEAGRSYRSWAPVLPAAYLFRATIAKASEITGSDWSAIARPSGSAGQQGAFQGAGSGSGAGSGGGIGAGSGAGIGLGAGSGAGIGLGAGVAALVLGLSLAFPTTAPEDAALTDPATAERTAAESTRPERASARAAAMRIAAMLEARRTRAILAARRSRQAEAPPPSQPVAGSPAQPPPSPATDEAGPAVGGETAPSGPNSEPAGDGQEPREPQRPSPAAQSPEPEDPANEPVESPASRSPPGPEPDEPEPPPQPEPDPAEPEPEESAPNPEPDGSEPTPEPEEPEPDSQPSDEPDQDESVPEETERSSTKTGSPPDDEG